MNSPIANNDIAMNSPTIVEQKQKKCGNCGEFGHNKRKCPHSPRLEKKVERKESNRKCGKCGEFGHNARTCPTVAECKPCSIVNPEMTVHMEFEERISIQAETSEVEVKDSIEMLESELTLVPVDDSEDEPPLVDISVLETGVGIFTYTDDGDTISTKIEWLTE